MDNMIIGILIGTTIGISAVMFFFQNANVDFETVFAETYRVANEICESVNSAPKSIDLDDELVCANGATFNYVEYANNDDRSNEK